METFIWWKLTKRTIFKHVRNIRASAPRIYWFLWKKCTCVIGEYLLEKAVNPNPIQVSLCARVTSHERPESNCLKRKWNSGYVYLKAIFLQIIMRKLKKNENFCDLWIFSGIFRIIGGNARNVINLKKEQKKRNGYPGPLLPPTPFLRLMKGNFWTPLILVHPLLNWNQN